MIISKLNCGKALNDIKTGILSGKVFEVKETTHKSADMLKRINGHLTQISRETGENREHLKVRLLRVCVDEAYCAVNGDPWPYMFIDVKLNRSDLAVSEITIMEPLGLSGRTNREMLTFYDVICDEAAKKDIDLKEKWC